MSSALKVRLRRLRHHPQDVDFNRADFERRRIEVEHQLAHAEKASAMMRRDAVSIESPDVRACGVTDIALPRISGIAQCKPRHEIVACDLCEYRGARDREAAGVAVNDCSMRDKKSS